MTVSPNSPVAIACLEPVSFSEIPLWPDENHLAAFQAFLPGAAKMQAAPYKTRKLGIDGIALQRAGKLALSLTDPTPRQARLFFENTFKPHVVTQTEEPGFVTGFFEPLVKASRTKSSQFPVPLYRRPLDLVDVDDSNRPADMDPAFRFGRQSKHGISEYFDRAAIQAGALEGKGLELAWVENKTIAFFIHVQGAARLILDTGEHMRVTYAAKTGHPYSSIARVLCQQTGTPPEQMTADRLADWMKDNPDRIDGLLAHNRSHIFFKQVTGSGATDGPLAAAKIPLVADRSLAVDKSLHTFGCPIWLTTDQPLPLQEKPLARLMFAHDTGSAIVGATRGDIFAGTGDKAGFIAGKIRHAARFITFVPKP